MKIGGLYYMYPSIFVNNVHVTWLFGGCFKFS